MARPSASSDTPTREQVLALVMNGKLEIKVAPNAKENALYLRAIEGENMQLCARLTVVPEAGKANAALIKMLAKLLSVPKSRISVIRGHTSRSKLLAIEE